LRDDRLAEGNVDIEGVVSLDGEACFEASFPYTYAEPGPGGFAGGARGFYSEGLYESGGFGPGGFGGFFFSFAVLLP